MDVFSFVDMFVYFMNSDVSYTIITKATMSDIVIQITLNLEVQ